MLRYLNMFVLIGIALIGISIVGFATGNRFLIEPGQGDNPLASLTYLGAGLLMIINGVVSIKNAPPQAERDEKDARERSSSADKRAAER